MRTATLLRRNLTFFWRTNAAVVLGVAAAVSVLSGALLVGDSVRSSLRTIFLGRLGATDHVVTAAGFFREDLADEIKRDGRFAAAGLRDAGPLVVLEGAVAVEDEGRRAAGVQVYGVDERFWKFHGVGDAAAPARREALASPSLADELKLREGDTLLLRVVKPSDIPAESLHGRKEDLGRTIRLTARGALDAERMGEFSVRPQQSAVRAVFVPLKLLQQDLDQEGKVNALLVSATDEGDAETASARTAALEKILRERAALEDLGIKLRQLPAENAVALETEAAVVSDALDGAAREAARVSGARVRPLLSYLANTIRAGGREIPYSLVTAVDEETFAGLRAGAGGQGLGDRGRGPGDGGQETDGRAASAMPAHEDAATASSPTSAQSPAPGPRRPPAPPSSDPLAPVLLNQWAASDLGARVGDELTLDYYVWKDDNRLATESAQFRVAGVVPIEGFAADRDLVPVYPGITESQSLSDWDPPFPVELRRVRPQDEDYWKQYRTTPKAFVPLDVGQRLWQTRFGKLTSLRVNTRGGTDAQASFDSFRDALRAGVDPARLGLAVFPARAEGVAASRGATDFGEYFLYFSFFIVVSALMLTVLFFKLGVEQRLREIGLLRAVGFPPARVRNIFLAEAAVLAVVGSLLGMAGAVLYGRLMVYGLRTWWVEAVGTTALALDVRPVSLAAGAIGGVVVALVCVVWTLRRLVPASPRSLLTGMAERQKVIGKRQKAERRGGLRHSPLAFLLLPFAFAAASFTLLAAAWFGLIGQVAGFFGGGTLLLVALLVAQAGWLRRARVGTIGGRGAWPVSRLGLRGATYKPARSVLCIALIASAAFIVVAVDAFRRDESRGPLARKDGTGGYALLASTLLPVIQDPNSREGRDALNLSADEKTRAALDGVTLARFRLRPGDDASCLNLYQPRRPRVLAPTEDFIAANRFSFQNSLAETREESENPWLLLRREAGEGGAVPVIADANSLAYVLHLGLGDEFVLEGEQGEPVRLRVVGALSDSIFQGELLMSESNFRRLFPEQEGYRFFLVEAPAARTDAAAALLEERLADYGFDAQSTSERLAGFHRVENTYLSTFQMLGGLGLVLGTLGLAAVLLRNVLERRRELALLRAVGYGRRHFALMALAENALLLCCGLVTGTVCALAAVAPVSLARGGRLPIASVALLLLAVLITGLASSLLATAAALRSPLIPTLRAE